MSRSRTCSRTRSRTIFFHAYRENLAFLFSVKTSESFLIYSQEAYKKSFKECDSGPRMDHVKFVEKFEVIWST